MSRRFYAGWAVAVLLALVLPVALPYVIWPPAHFDRASGSGDCAAVAKDYAVSEAHRSASMLLPLSAGVERCRGTLPDVDLEFDVVVKARGPYGIPFASAEVSRAGSQWSESISGGLFGLFALMSGVAVVSLPFALVMLRRSLRLRLAAA
jgi:hypothetical protein